MEEQAVTDLVGEVEQGWNTHDMARFAACFAEDADFVNVRGWWWRGREEIERAVSGQSSRPTEPVAVFSLAVLDVMDCHDHRLTGTRPEFAHDR
jgi:uncharacterized protein (TIGR02246 family)